jgi:hypothetical protein
MVGADVDAKRKLIGSGDRIGKRFILEIVYEVSVEYGDEFKELGGEHVQLVESLNDHPLWIDSLEGLVKGQIN